MKKWRFAFLIPAVAVLLFAIHFLLSGLSDSVLQFWIAWSAKISFGLFTLAFSASALNRFFRSRFTTFLLKYRSQLGVAFALNHLFHLALLVYKDTLVTSVFSERSLTSLIPGVLSYLFIGLMLLTSFDFFSRKISKKAWSVLHTTGGYIILFTFTAAYLKRIDQPNYLPFILLALGVWVIRFLNMKKPAGSLA